MSTEGIVTAVAALLGGGGVVGAFKLWTEHRRESRETFETAIEKARAEALAQARLEAVAREATAALEAKNRELDAVKLELQAHLANCPSAKEGRG